MLLRRLMQIEPRRSESAMKQVIRENVVHFYDQDEKKQQIVRENKKRGV